MKLSYSLIRKVLATGLALAAAGVSGLAQARDNVFWSIGVNATPGVAVTAGNVPPVIVAPAPVYVTPAPVYMAPAPVYMAPAPRVYYAPAPVYRPAPVYYGGGYYEEPRYYGPPGHHKHKKHFKYEQLRY